MPDSFNAFVGHRIVSVAGKPGGPARGLTFAVKDLFDVAGEVTGCGNPDWAATHPRAERNAWAVEALLSAGATYVGKTHTDEISLGLLGENRFYGTPVNPRAPERVPGGSSSGSAVAVAGGLADAALGSDTAGSTRVPASFCGVFGIRPTHGRVGVAGLMRQAPGFDTVGWFARDARTLERVGSILLQGTGVRRLPARMVILKDAFALADPEIIGALAPTVKALCALAGEVEEVTIGEPDLSVWQQSQINLQRAEYSRTFMEWLDATNPRMSFHVARNLVRGSLIDRTEEERAGAVRERAVRRVQDILADGVVACMPTTVCLPPFRGRPLSELAPISQRLLMTCCIAGLTGVPQLSMPAGTVAGVPVGLSILAAQGEDELLLATALSAQA